MNNCMAVFPDEWAGRERVMNAGRVSWPHLLEICTRFLCISLVGWTLKMQYYHDWHPASLCTQTTTGWISPKSDKNMARSYFTLKSTKKYGTKASEAILGITKMFSFCSLMKIYLYYFIDRVCVINLVLFYFILFYLISIDRLPYTFRLI